MADGRRITTQNTRFEKEEIWCLNKTMYFFSSSIVAYSFRLRNRQLLVAANRLNQF